MKSLSWIVTVAAIVLAMAMVCAPLTAQQVDIAAALMQQDVSELKRVVQQQEMRLQAMEQELADVRAASGAAPTARASAGGGSLATSSSSALSSAGVVRQPSARPTWLDTADWDKLKPGTAELDVVRILGVPNSLRSADTNRQVLYYAVEIGTGRFLSGTVTLIDHRVSEVQKPTIK
jgi:hypothetical protein